MDSLSSAPGNRNNTKSLLSAVFAIAASISGSVNAATAPTPKFTDEPAGSPKILDVAKAQQAILDMLPADHKSRPGIAAAIKSLEDGGSVQELTNLFIWAKTIVDSPMSPPAAKEKAKEIITSLTLSAGWKTEATSLVNYEALFTRTENQWKLELKKDRPLFKGKKVWEADKEKEFIRMEEQNEKALAALNVFFNNINNWKMWKGKIEKWKKTGWKAKIEKWEVQQVYAQTWMISVPWVLFEQNLSATYQGSGSLNVWYYDKDQKKNGETQTITPGDFTFKPPVWSVYMSIWILVEPINGSVFEWLAVTRKTPQDNLTAVK